METIVVELKMSAIHKQSLSHFGSYTSLYFKMSKDKVVHSLKKKFFIVHLTSFSLGIFPCLHCILPYLKSYFFCILERKSCIFLVIHLNDRSHAFLRSLIVFFKSSEWKIPIVCIYLVSPCIHFLLFPCETA